MIEDNSASRQTDDSSANVQTAPDLSTNNEPAVDQSNSRVGDSGSSQAVSRSAESTIDRLRNDAVTASPSDAQGRGAIKSEWANNTSQAEERGELPKFALDDKGPNSKNEDPASSKHGGESKTKDHESDKKGSDTTTGAGEHVGKMHDGGTARVDHETLMDNVKTVAEVAKEKGVDPATAVASMMVESGGDHKVVGDKGTSFGLFQLHKGGELGNLSQKQASNPRTNADVALSEFARIQDRHSDPGKLAAAAQRPAHPEQYAKKVNAMLPNARRLIEQADV